MGLASAISYILSGLTKFSALPVCFNIWRQLLKLLFPNFFQPSWFDIIENTKLTAQILIGSLRFVFIGSKEVLWAEARQLDINFKGLIIAADYVWSSCLKLLPRGSLRKLHFISHALLQEIIMIVDELTKTYLMSMLHRKHSLQTRKSIRLALPSPHSTI